MFSRNGGGSDFPQPTSATTAVTSIRARIEYLAFIDLLTTETRTSRRLAPGLRRISHSAILSVNLCALCGKKRTICLKPECLCWHHDFQFFHVIRFERDRHAATIRPLHILRIGCRAHQAVARGRAAFVPYLELQWLTR